MRICLIFLLFLVQSAFGGLTWETAYREIQVPASQKDLLVDFPFKNAGPDRVDISSIETSCGCTSAKVDSKPVSYTHLTLPTN